MVENLNEDRLQPSIIRYAFHSLVLVIFISIAYGNGFISSIIQSVVVDTKAYEIFFVIELATPMWKFLVFLWGLGAQCA